MGHIGIKIYNISNIEGLIFLMKPIQTLVTMLSLAHQVPLAGSVGRLTLPHLGIGVGVGAVDAALLPLLAAYVDNHMPNTHYSSVYALTQAAVAGAYCAGRDKTLSEKKKKKILKSNSIIDNKIS